MRRPSWVLVGAAVTLGVGATAAFATVTSPLAPAPQPAEHAAAAAHGAVPSAAASTSADPAPAAPPTTVPTTQPVAEPDPVPAPVAEPEPVRAPAPRRPAKDPAATADDDRTSAALAGCRLDHRAHGLLAADPDAAGHGWKSDRTGEAVDPAAAAARAAKVQAARDRWAAAVAAAKAARAAGDAGATPDGDHAGWHRSTDRDRAAWHRWDGGSGGGRTGGDG